MSKSWKFLISCTTVGLLTFSQLAQGADLPNYLMQTRLAKPVELQRRMLTLPEMIQRAPYPSAFMQPIPLHGVNVSGLQAKNVDTLGFNYFVVVDNSKYQRMTDVYKETRVTGKSNFVTADSIIHPYLAFSNRVLADVCTRQMKPDTISLLEAMQAVSLEDYGHAEDAEVREDISRNIAFLSVGIKLLKPEYELPRVGHAREMAEADLRSIVACKPVQSAIFNRREDFSFFRPLGWYDSSPELQNFYRCRQWLSQIPYPIDDMSSGEEGHATNNFRRSVLLFRCLDDARLLGKPAMEMWAKLMKAYALLGTPVDAWHERALYPPDYKMVFQDRPADLKVTLAALAEPLYRTKLMLAIRRQKPVNLSATSIFEIEEGNDEGASTASFRLFPVVCQPETRWFHSVARHYPQDKQVASTWPLGLFNSYIWGSAQAGNILTDMMWMLDPELSKVLPDLQHCVLKRGAGGQSQVVDSRTWKILSSLFKPPPDGTAGALRTDLWGSHRLVSALGGWVDSMAAIAPPNAAPTDTADLQVSASSPAFSEKKEADGLTPGSAANGAPKSINAISNGAGTARKAGGPGATAAPTGATAATTGATTASAAAAQSAEAANNLSSEESQPRVATRRSKIPPYHYLEPALDTYRQLDADAQKLQADLIAAHYLPDEYKPRFGDFIRLFQRLEKISETEMRNFQVSVVDRRLLANIDQVLDKVDVPLPAVVSFQSVPKLTKGTQDSKEEPATPGGINLAVGRPGLIYVVYQNPASSEWTLGRGAVYTYYEMPAPVLTTSMWQHRIEAGFAHPPLWAAKYQVVQHQLPPKNPTATAAVSKTH